MRKTSSQYIYELAKLDDRIIFIGSDLGVGAMSDYKKEMPERFFMDGISEQHIIGFAAGLASEGFIPFVNTICTFLTRRCYEQIVINLCLDNLPVILMGNGGGLVYAPLGPTHMAIEDIAILRAIPNMTVIAPCDPLETKKLMAKALGWGKPIYFKIGPSGAPTITSETTSVSIGQPVIMKEPDEILIVSTGYLTQSALKAVQVLERTGIHVGLLHAHTLKPFNRKVLLEFARKVKAILTLEENVGAGGLGSLVLEILSDENIYPMPRIKRMSLPDQFPDGYGDQEYLLQKYNLTEESTILEVKKILAH